MRIASSSKLKRKYSKKSSGSGSSSANNNNTNKKKKNKQNILPDAKKAVTPVSAYGLKISNVVCTAWAGKTLSLRMVQLATQGRLDGSVFPSSVSRARNPATTNSIFDTGCILITGAPSTDYALYSAIKFVDKLNKELNNDLCVLDFAVQNIVSSFSLGYPLNIDMFYKDQKVTRYGTAAYEPSRFRGCSWHPVNPDRERQQAFVLFASGRVVLTGAKTWDEAYDAYDEALPILARYRLGKEYKTYDSRYRRTRDVDVNITHTPPPPPDKDEEKHVKVETSDATHGLGVLVYSEPSVKQATEEDLLDIFAELEQTNSSP